MGKKKLIKIELSTKKYKCILSDLSGILCIFLFSLMQLLAFYQTSNNSSIHL
jgi:hypothetical protein